MKTILVTGASSGIGKAITQQLLNENHRVIGLARTAPDFTQAKNYVSVPIDFANIDTLEKNLKEVLNQFSEIDTLIAAAGYGEFAELEQFSVEQIQRMMNVNFISQAVLVKTFISQFKKNKSGQIILVGSECALEGQKKGSIYCATKFALRGFSQSIRKECATANIPVTLINPGMVETPFFDKLNFRPEIGKEFSIHPQQIADLVSMLVRGETNCVYEEINLQPLKKAIKKTKTS